MKQNVDVSCSESSNSQHKTGCYTIAACFPFEPLEKCMTFRYFFTGLSRSWNFQEKIQDFLGSPGGSGTLYTRSSSRQLYDHIVVTVASLQSLSCILIFISGGSVLHCNDCIHCCTFNMLYYSTKYF